VTGTEPSIVVADAPAASRYEVRVDGELAGFAEYRLTPARIVFTHTEVADELEGHGLAARLVRFALDDARRRQLQVVARCPYVARFIEEHPEYRDLLTPR
jgi:predicted GNAT family acetyltransferase